MSINTKGKPSRSVARLNAVQALFQIENSGDSPNSVVIQFLDHRLGQATDDGPILKQPDTTLFSTLVIGASKDLEPIDELIAGYLDKSWPLHRVQLVLKSILRVATWELMHAKDTPTPVIINEYLDVTRAFYDDKEVGFINGVLDKLAKHIRPQ